MLQIEIWTADRRIKLGEFNAAAVDVEIGHNRGVLRRNACVDVSEMLGPGFFEQPFRMVVDGEPLQFCRITRRAGMIATFVHEHSGSSDTWST